MLENLKVKNIVIGSQAEISENYIKFLKIVEQKNIKVHVVKANQRINIENKLYFYILWPDTEKMISDNALNNNSLVCKLIYKNFSMLFTGDIEEMSEHLILSKYANNLNIFNSTVLKVAHHGSKTSSTKEWLDAVKPDIALIGVGKDNKFGHPSSITINRLELINCKIYRTDESGEIIVSTNGIVNKVTKHRFIAIIK